MNSETIRTARALLIEAGVAIPIITSATQVGNEILISGEGNNRKYEIRLDTKTGDCLVFESVPLDRKGP